MFIIIVLLLVIGAVLFCMKPSINTLRKARFKSFEHSYIAHRGLHDNAHGVPENSMLAFRRAISCGFGIELDVRLTADGQLAVIHDENLKGVCGVDVNVGQTSYEELKTYPLMGTDERIPLLSDVLNEIDGRVPLIIEIKADRVFEDICSLTAKALEDYGGDVCIQSFSPYAVEWFKKHTPDILRGQLSMNFFDARHKRKESFPIKLILTLMLYNFKAQPDYIAYDYIAYNSPVMYIMRNIFGAETAGWTMVSQRCIDDLAGSKFDIVIFEGFMPREKENILY